MKINKEDIVILVTLLCSVVFISMAVVAGAKWSIGVFILFSILGLASIASFLGFLSNSIRDKLEEDAEYDPSRNE